MILARCPDCAKGLKLKPSAAGKTVKCPACGAGVPVPAGDRAPDGAPDGAPRKPTNTKRKRAAPPEPTGSGNSGELFTGLNLGGHGGGSKKALPGRIQKGPLTDEMPIADAGGKKKKEEPPTPMPVVLGVIGGSLLLLAAVGGGAFYFLANNQPIAAPTEFERYEHPEQRKFSLDVPVGWERTDGGGTGGTPAFASFEGPGGEVQIRQSLSGSAIGDMGAAADANLAPGEELPEELTPIYRQHEATKGQIESNFSDYSETGGENFDARGADGRRSTFTASGAFGGTLTGYRGTLRIGNETYTVVTQSSPRDFAVMGPVYEQMLKSMGR